MMEQLIEKSKVEKAIKALIKCEDGQKQKKSKKDLLEEPGHIYLMVGLKKIPEASKAKPIKIPVKHSFRAESLQVCLFTKDPQHQYKELLKKKSINNISKVIGISKLRAKYKPFEAKRLLCNSYDLFLADNSIVPMLPKLLGKEFFKKKKIPFPISLKKSNLHEEIEEAIHSTFISIATGPCFSVKIGSLAQSPSEIAENIIEALPYVVKKGARKWKNIQSLNLKTTKSIALPIYNSLLDPDTNEPSSVAVAKKDSKVTTN